jgi:hypothetical protein
LRPLLIVWRRFESLQFYDRWDEKVRVAVVAGVSFGILPDGHRARWSECCRATLVRVYRITQQAIRRGTFSSVKDWVEKIDHYVKNFKRQVQLFVWMEAADSIFAEVERRCERISGDSTVLPTGLNLFELYFDWLCFRAQSGFPDHFLGYEC